MERLGNIPVSLHCWQGDDVGGLESDEGLSGGGIMATGGYLGKARIADELPMDLDKAFSLILGKHRLNLHAIAQEIIRGGFLERVHIGLDFFDASINRCAGGHKMD